MAIENAKLEQAGDSGIFPAIIYILTNDTVENVTKVGYLNGLAAQNLPLSELQIALVSTKTSPNSPSTQVNFFPVSKNGGNYSLAPSLSSGTLLNIQKFEATQNYIPTFGMQNCLIQCLGGGGAGGGTGTAATMSAAAGAGGGAGAYSQSYVSADIIGTSQLVTVGNGGLGITNANGLDGSASSVGSIITAPGGKGGAGGVTSVISNISLGNGSTGGIPGVGDSSFKGGDGGAAIFFNAGGIVSGAGGDSYFSGGARSLFTTVGATFAGNNADANSGSGGSGSLVFAITGTNMAGGNGGSGLVIIWEFR